MYSQRDIDEINGRIRRNVIALAPVLAALLAAYIYGLHAGIQWLAMAAGALLVVTACYGVLAYLWPNMRYRSFLYAMQDGLTRTVRGTILEIADQAELQDGAMVLPVRLKLSDEDAGAAEARHTSALAERLRLEQAEESGGEAERLLYLNASKRQDFPGPGTAVSLICSGRHIKQVDAA